MADVSYPVPQAPVTGGPGSPPWPMLLFALPGTLPVVTSIRGVPQDPLVVGQPKLILLALPAAPSVTPGLLTALDQDALLLIGQPFLIRPGVVDLSPIFLTLPTLQDLLRVDLSRLLPQAVIPPPPAPPVGGARKTPAFLRRLQWLKQRPGPM